MINPSDCREIVVDTEHCTRDKVFHDNLKGGFYYGTVYAFNYHARLTKSRKDSLTLFPQKSTPQRSVSLRILSEIGNCLFQSLSPFYSPLLPMERLKG